VEARQLGLVAHDPVETFVLPDMAVDCTGALKFAG